MPRVPLPGELLSGGASAPLRAPGVAPRVDATGVQIERFGRAVEDLGRVAADIGAQQEADLNNAHATEADNLLASQIEEILKNPQSGYLNQRGRDAATEGSRTRADDAIAEEVRRIEGMLQNDVQKGMFGQVAQRRLADATSRMNTHQARQIEVYALGQSEARVESAALAGAEAIFDGDGQRADEQMTLGLNEVGRISDIMGESPEELDARRLALTTDIHAQVVDRLTRAERSGEAADYIRELDQDAMRERVDPRAMARMQDVVRTAVLGDEASAMAFEVIDRADAEVAKRETGETEAGEGDLLRVAGALLDGRVRRDLISPELRDATMERIEDEIRRRSRVRAADNNNLRTRIETVLAQNPTMGLTQLPASDQDEILRAGMWDTLRGFAEIGRYSTNWTRHAQLQVMTPSDFLKMDEQELMDSLRGEVSTAQINWAMAQWRQVRGRNTAEDDQRLQPKAMLERAAMDIEMFDRTPAGRPSGTPEQWARFDRLEEEFLDRLDVKAQGLTPGTSVPPEQVQEIIDELFSEAAYKPTGLFGLGAGQTVPVDALSEDEREEFLVDNFLAVTIAGDERNVAVPVALTEVITEIGRQLRASNKDDSLQSIHRAWLAIGKPQTLKELNK